MCFGSISQGFFGTIFRFKLNYQVLVSKSFQRNPKCSNLPIPVRHMHLHIYISLSFGITKNNFYISWVKWLFVNFVLMGNLNDSVNQFITITRILLSQHYIPLYRQDCRTIGSSYKIKWAKDFGSCSIQYNHEDVLLTKLMWTKWKHY